MKSLKTLRQIFITLAFFVSFSSHANDGVLWIGDSLSNGDFTKVIFNRLQEFAPKQSVHVISSPGSSPRDWLSSSPIFKTKWDLHNYSKNSFLKIKNGETPKLKNLLSQEAPSVLLIQQGTNLFWGWADGNTKNLIDIKKDLSDFLLELKEFPNTQCVWVAPPDTSRWKTEIEDVIFHEIRKAVEQRCVVVDSRISTRYPAGGDGIHYPANKAGQAEQKKWIDQVVSTLKALPKN